MRGRFWSEDETKYLLKHWSSVSPSVMADTLGRSLQSIMSKGYKLGLCYKREEKRLKWSKEEMDFLQEKWGSISIKGIAHHLKRSIEAVKIKAFKLGLGDPSLYYEGITLNQLALATNISYNVWKNWIKLYDFPIKRKIFSKDMKVMVVTYKDLWKWAEKNKQMIDFSRIEKNILGPEPSWVEEKRNADFIKARKIKKSNNHAWSVEEDNILKGMLKSYKYTYPEISQRINRSEGAIKRRIVDLGIKARPLRLNNHVKYTPDEVNLIVELFDKGHCLEDIAHRINKSALGVRGKLERMGYKFMNGVPIKEMVKKSDKELLSQWI